MRGILLAVTNSKVGEIGNFVGFENFARLLKDPIFHSVVYNTFLYTFVTTVFKLILGLWLALLLNRDFKFKAFTRAFVLLPFIVPTVLACFAWKWMFDPTFSVINWMLFKLGVVAAGAGVNWLGDGDLAMLSIMIVNIWRGVPFFAISLMAGRRPSVPTLVRPPRSTVPSRGSASCTLPGRC
jgi:multiple sugar transport system permease protein